MAAATAGRVRVTQVRSPIGRQKDQLEDTPSVRGMIDKVRHLIRVEEIG